MTEHKNITSAAHELLYAMTRIAADLSFALDRGTIKEDFGNILLHLEDQLHDFDRKNKIAWREREKAAARNKVAYGRGTQ